MKLFYAEACHCVNRNEMLQTAGYKHYYHDIKCLLRVFVNSKYICSRNTETLAKKKLFCFWTLYEIYVLTQPHKNILLPNFMWYNCKVYQYIYNSQQSTHFNDIQSNISSSKLTMAAAHQEKSPHITKRNFSCMQFCQDLKGEKFTEL